MPGHPVRRSRLTYAGGTIMSHASQNWCPEPFFPEPTGETSPDPFWADADSERRPDQETLPSGIRSMEHWLDLNA